MHFLAHINIFIYMYLYTFMLNDHIGELTMNIASSSLPEDHDRQIAQSMDDLQDKS